MDGVGNGCNSQLIDIVPGHKIRYDKFKDPILNIHKKTLIETDQNKERL